MARRPAPVRVRIRASGVWDQMARENLSQNDLGRRIGITSGYLSQLINGARSPSAELRRLVLEALPNAAFDDLFIVEHRTRSGDYVPVPPSEASRVGRGREFGVNTVTEVGAW